MLEVLLAEHDEDLARLGGYLAGTRAPAGRRGVGGAAPVASPAVAAAGLAGAMASAVIVGSFEEELTKNVLLAFFVPGVVYMADAVGTQTETVLIRGMSAGIRVRKVLWRELLTGALVGLLIGGAFLPFALIAWGDASWPSQWPSPLWRVARWPRSWRWACRRCFSASAATPRSAPARWPRSSRTCCRS